MTRPPPACPAASDEASCGPPDAGNQRELAAAALVMRRRDA
jgi:hypothetical protein